MNKLLKVNQVRGNAVHICSGGVRKTVDFVRGCSGGLRELFGFVRVVFDSASGVVREGFGIASGWLRVGVEAIPKQVRSKGEAGRKIVNRQS